MKINCLLQEVLNVYDKDEIRRTIEDKEWTKYYDLSSISFTGKESDIQKYLHSINCELLIAVLPPFFSMQLTQSSNLLETITKKCHQDAELFTLTDMYSNKVAMFGIVRFLDDISMVSDNPPS